MGAPTARRRPRSLLILLSLVVVTACGGKASGPPVAEPIPPGSVVTREDISEMSNVQTAMEVLERARTALVIQRTRNGGPVRIYHRGVGSLALSPQVLVVVDGSPVQDGVAALEGIPASSVLYIQVLSGREGAMRYGAAAGNGVVSVRTSAG